MKTKYIYLFFLTIYTLAAQDNTSVFEGKTILITGGAGFLGKALTQRILNENPHKIIIYSRDEFKHYNFLNFFKNNPKLHCIIGDVRDYNRLEWAMKNVDIVVHAAALKRIDSLEYNTSEAVITNILGSLNVANACLKNRVKKAILISTDKACLPINTYGACKFVAERVFANFNFENAEQTDTIFTTVRYGNVLESTGSVIPFFMGKIKNGEDVPLTDARMTRFIISKEQAVDLICDAIRYGVGGEIFIPRLPAFKITDLIDVLAKAYGKNTVNIKKIGIRPGEKLHETMLSEFEIARTYAFNNRFVIASVLDNVCNKPCTRGHLKLSDSIYAEEGTLLSFDTMKEYSSKDAIISKDELEQLFFSVGLLNK